MLFRAVIKEINSTVLFDFDDLIHPNPLFSVRELVIPWLKAGNKPDRYTNIHCMTGKRIFEGE